MFFRRKKRPDADQSVLTETLRSLEDLIAETPEPTPTESGQTAVAAEPPETSNKERPHNDGAPDYVRQSKVTQQDQIPDVNEDQQPDVTKGQTLEITEGHMPKITEDHMPDITEGQMPHITEGQMPDITEGQMPDITEGQMSHITEDQMPHITVDDDVPVLTNVVYMPIPRVSAEGTGATRGSAPIASAQQAIAKELVNAVEDRLDTDGEPLDPALTQDLQDAVSASLEDWSIRTQEILLKRFTPPTKK